MKKEARLISYFSLPTDLAAVFRSWSEFESGEGYDVSLRCRTTGERVRTECREMDGIPFVSVTSEAAGQLYKRVIEAATTALREHSDTVDVWECE